MGNRLLDVNRNLGRPDKLTVIFGRRITKGYSGKLQTDIEDLHLGNPVMRSYYKNDFAKHYARDHDVLRFETAGNDVKRLSPSSECAARYFGDFSESRRA